MNCPTCVDTTLALADRQGIEIDYCPHCRGVWLDRGELDKLIERMGEPVARESQERDHREPRARAEDRRGDRDDDDDDDERRRRGDQKKSRRGSMLGDLFDFGG